VVPPSLREPLHVRYVVVCVRGFFYGENPRLEMIFKYKIIETKKEVMKPDQLRQAYLQFFVDRQHAVVPSSPLVPENDPTTLFTGSGMQPMMPYLLGEVHPKGTRIVDAQKCFRSQDIEEVGDNRHTTFFEMIGNWSLGDYFKKEQLEWFFSFLVDEVGLDPQRLYVTVFGGDQAIGIPQDDEAIEVWQQLFGAKGIKADFIANAAEQGMQGGRIFAYPATKNWWSRAGVPQNMPVGEPGGPDSEVFYDFGAELKLHENSPFKDEVCHVNCDCGRFLEIGNNVFMTYQRTSQGFEPLRQKNIDFGGGLERILAAQNNNPDVFTTDLFNPIIARLEHLSEKSYTDTQYTHAFRIIADHLRAAVMLAADGVYPSNKEQGYFARRLLRRAIRYGKQLGIEVLFLGDLVPVISDIYASAYPEVSLQQAKIATIFHQEEEKFNKTIAKGLREFNKLAGQTLTAEVAFGLYETFGFPLELSLEEATREGIAIPTDIDQQFMALKQHHAAASRTASAGTFKGGLADQSQNTIKYHTATHLLHAALRQVLGTHVQQKGSNITGERLRFDFSHTAPVTPEQQKQVQQLINEWITADVPVTKQILPKQVALDSGAIAFFIEKYPDEVSVYTIGQNPDGVAGDIAQGWISKEFCGGPHVTHTGEIGKIELFKEQSASAGVRRIYVRLA
jgi:alanyl-tRNA synthetase